MMFVKHPQLHWPVMSKYNEIGPNKYTNLFGFQRIDRTNITIYSDAHELTERISKYIWYSRVEQMNIQIYSEGHEMTK